MPFQPGAFSSALRSKRGTTIIGISLATAVVLCFVTGLYSHVQQKPVDWLTIPPIPASAYRVSQGVHMIAGIAAIPLLLLKLWSVYPRLWAWPPIKSVLHGLERLSIFILVGAMILQLATGMLNNTQFYPWEFPFVATHYAIAFVIVGAILVHLGVHGSDIAKALRRRHNVVLPPAVGSLDTDADTEPDATAEPGAVSGSAAATSLTASTENPRDADGSLTRRGLLVTGGLAVGAVTVTTVGQTVAPLQDVAALAPRIPSIGPQNVPVNRTAKAAKVTPLTVGNSYRLTLVGAQSQEFTLAELREMPQTEVVLPISCVEGWSANAAWVGIQMQELVRLAGGGPTSNVRVMSLEDGGLFGRSQLPSQFANHPLTILALQLNGEPLDLDHGYPARIMAPNRPGVLQTKWVNRLEVT
ncbi:MAG: molybdopterin-dependent oxidoreductase [Actinomycetia bacterium]|nr:molybdopterin-dependent oxidoreductase [Actinomycetes bacterium]